VTNGLDKIKPHFSKRGMGFCFGGMGSEKIKGGFTLKSLGRVPNL